MDDNVWQLGLALGLAVDAGLLLAAGVSGWAPRAAWLGIGGPILVLCATGLPACVGIARLSWAAYWTHRYFGYGWQADLMLCIANRESHYTLGATHQNYPTSYGVDYGPWQVNQPSHPWVDFYRIVRSWKYATAVAWRISAHGTNFSPWGGGC